MLLTQAEVAEKWTRVAYQAWCGRMTSNDAEPQLVLLRSLRERYGSSQGVSLEKVVALACIEAMNEWDSIRAAQHATLAADMEYAEQLVVESREATS